MNSVSYEHNVRVNRDLRIVPLAAPRKAFRVWKGGTDIWIEEGEVVALAYESLGFTWDGCIEERQQTVGNRSYTERYLHEGPTSNVAEPFKWITYVFLGFSGEVDNTPLDDDVDLYWDKSSAEERVTALREAAASPA